MSLESLEIIEQQFGPTAYVRGLKREFREEGLLEARLEFITALLRERFGDHTKLPELAAQLADWTDAATAVHAISIASTLDDVPTTPPATHA